MAIEAFLSIEASGVARVDFLMDQANGQVYVNEINTLPGSISFYLWEHSGMKPQQLVDELIDLANQRFQEMNRTRYVSDQLLIQNIDLLSLNKA